MEKKIYRSKIDWWIACMVFFAIVIVWAACIGSDRWVMLVYGGAITFLTVFLMFGIWYEIKGDELLVYQYFRPRRFPISKIAEVKKTTGYLATAGLSSSRVSIKFVNRSVLKSCMSLEISPKDRNDFIARLKEINPSIVTDSDTNP